MRVQLFTSDGKELHYSDVSKIETTDTTITLYGPNERVIGLSKKKIVKLVSYV